MNRRKKSLTYLLLLPLLLVVLLQGIVPFSILLASGTRETMERNTVDIIATDLTLLGGNREGGEGGGYQGGSGGGYQKPAPRAPAMPAPTPPAAPAAGNFGGGNAPAAGGFDDMDDDIPF